MNRCDTLRKLNSILDEILERPEDLFQNIVTRIDADCLSESLRITQLAALSTRPLTLEELRQALAFGSDHAYYNLSDWEESEDFLESGEQMKIFIESRTKGLVEVSKQASNFTDYVQKNIRGINDHEESQASCLLVRMLHETAKHYFLRGNGFEHITNLLNNAPRDVQTPVSCRPQSISFEADGHHYIAQACSNYLELRDLPLLRMLCLAKEADFGRFMFAQYALENCLVHAREAESRDGILSHQHIVQSLIRKYPNALDLYVCWAAEYNLKSWIRCLRASGADFDTPKLLYRYAIKTVVERGFVDMVKMLLESNKDGFEMFQKQDRLLQLASLNTSRPGSYRTLYGIDERSSLDELLSVKSNIKDRLRGRPHSVLTQEIDSYKQKDYLRYERVNVLLLSWLEDDLNADSEIEALEISFVTLNYNVRRIRLRSDSKHKQQLQLNFAIAHFAKQDDTIATLQIVYYAGHGHPGRTEGQLAITCGVRCEHGSQSGPHDHAIWNDVAGTFIDAQADTLHILDCCHAGNMMYSADFGDRTIEILAACRADEMTSAPGERSFTSGLIWALRQLSLDSGIQGISTCELVRKIKQYPEFPHRQTPQLMSWNTASQRPIILSPLPRLTSS
ncbi:hypothetical protein MMC18_001414 [Xylographa bjoerkii]|nr:hypothetical protein [Xylographa bjoerkii]